MWCGVASRNCVICCCRVVVCPCGWEELTSIDIDVVSGKSDVSIAGNLGNTYVERVHAEVKFNVTGAPGLSAEGYISGVPYPWGAGWTSSNESETSAAAGRSRHVGIGVATLTSPSVGVENGTSSFAKLEDALVTFTPDGIHVDSTECVNFDLRGAGEIVKSDNGSSDDDIPRTSSEEDVVVHASVFAPVGGGASSLGGGWRAALTGYNASDFAAGAVFVASVSSDGAVTATRGRPRGMAGSTDPPLSRMMIAQSNTLLLLLSAFLLYCTTKITCAHASPLR